MPEVSVRFGTTDEGEFLIGNLILSVLLVQWILLRVDV
jgi:hypothetical protein